MDPQARRKMWSVIESVSQNRSVILVSHSMEECEALCTRVGIMVSGRLQCLGSCQHLKGKFGAGYQIEVRCKEDLLSSSTSSTGAVGLQESVAFASSQQQPQPQRSPQLQACYEICETIAGPSLEVLECHGNYLRVKTLENIDLASAFGLMEQGKERCGIVDYSITQATLEQIFIRFAKEQEEEQGQHPNINIGAIGIGQGKADIIEGNSKEIV